jgi:hypothetical protein
VKIRKRGGSPKPPRKEIPFPIDEVEAEGIKKQVERIAGYLEYACHYAEVGDRSKAIASITAAQNIVNALQHGMMKDLFERIVNSGKVKQEDLPPEIQRLLDM